MAKYHDGYMGAFNGKLGPAVAYIWKGRPCIRAYQPNPKDPKSAKQLRCRMIFGTTSRLASEMQDAIEIGLQGMADYRKTSAHNTFVSLNRHCITVEDDMVNIDYPSLKLSDGELPGVAFGEVHSSEHHEISVDYDRAEGECGYNTDYVYLYAYVPSLKYGLLSLPSARSAHSVSLALPTSWAGHEAHLYGFVWDHDHEASPSSYIGRITI